MSNVNNQGFSAKFSRVLHYIDQHLGQPLSLEELAAVATSSKYHFHRQFSYIAGMPPYRYIQLQRLKKAGYQLSFRSHYKVIDIALEAGFENAESFSRAFKQQFGQSPMAFRKQPDWTTWQAKFEINAFEECNAMTTKITDVEIIDFPTTTVAAFEHKGPPQSVMNSVRTFIQWRKRNKLGPQITDTYNIFYHAPGQVAAQDYRMDICASVPTEISANPENVVNKTIDGGRCARLRHTGSDALLQNAIQWLYNHWLEQSGEQLRDFPLFVQRVNLFPEVSEQEMITDIYLPLQ